VIARAEGLCCIHRCPLQQSSLRFFRSGRELFFIELQRRGDAINSIYCRKKREERKEKLYCGFLILRIFATFAAEKYSFSSPPRLCGSKPDHAVATVSRSCVLVSAELMPGLPIKTRSTISMTLAGFLPVGLRELYNTRSVRHQFVKICLHLCCRYRGCCLGSSKSFIINVLTCHDGLWMFATAGINCRFFLHYANCINGTMCPNIFNLLINR